MQKIIQLQLTPSAAISPQSIYQQLAEHLGCSEIDISGFNILKRSVDARQHAPKIILTLQAFISEPFINRLNIETNFYPVKTNAKKVIIIGGGPAGLFAALKLVEKGIQPVILERGKDVRNRRRDLAILNKDGVINPDSNYCFGEGGAGTYSDGKLYTRSKKRGVVADILNLFVQFGAPDNILYDAHPHIGTNKLPQIITSMREKILACGGLFLFEKKVVGLNISGDRIESVTTSSGETFNGEAVILATGHSARDIFVLLHSLKISIEFKPFALGVRVEHPQELINAIQYHNNDADQLPPASYNLVTQTNESGVFSFCMCPGGIIAPAATAAGEVVVNGWSPSKRNNPFANSGIVAEVNEKNVSSYIKHGPLSGMYFQEMVEKRSYDAGGGSFVAPGQRLVDFVNNSFSSSLPECSYLPGIKSSLLSEVLPPYIYQSLATAFKEFGKKMKPYLTNEAIVVATESRTSSPVRIPRDPVLCHHPQLMNLFPCGEGAGYAGGIVSAAMDGQKIAMLVSEMVSPQ